MAMAKNSVSGKQKPKNRRETKRNMLKCMKNIKI